MYKISYAVGGYAMSMTVKAESEGEAMERFDLMVDGTDDAADVEFLSIKEI